MIMEYTYMMTSEETSGYMTPEWVNKWPNSMTYIMMIMMTYIMMKLSA
jgi:hypothetical protein